MVKGTNDCTCTGTKCLLEKMRNSMRGHDVVTIWGILIYKSFIIFNIYILYEKKLKETEMRVEI
jgi:hypothetical protein